MMRNWFYMALLVCSVVSAQEKDKDLPKGNEAFAEKQYADAEADYRVSASRWPQKAAPAYNLGNAIYRQNQSAESKGFYLKAAKTAKTYQEKHFAYHNLGNVYMNEKNYQAAVEAYKNALRNNPADEQTRYNYALAKKFLKENPPPPKKDKKDDKKDQKKQPKPNEKKDKEKQKDQKPQGDKPKDEPNPQSQPKPKEGGISKQRLESMLDAVKNEEQKTQQKVDAKKVKGRPVQTEKDW
jgi:tetratricopeptide (TPR) repeat protein